MEGKRSKDKPSEIENKNKGLFETTVITTILVILYHCAFRSMVTAKTPIPTFDILTWLVLVGVLVTVTVFICMEEGKERMGSAFLVAVVAVVAAYGIAYGVHVDMETVATIAIIASIIAVIVAAANAGRTGNASWQAFGIYTFEAIISFMTIFLFLRLFRM